LQEKEVKEHVARQLIEHGEESDLDSAKLLQEEIARLRS
jgi:hypothetical protein